MSTEEPTPAEPEQPVDPTEPNPDIEPDVEQPEPA
jgi:hypothetical protein